MPEFKFPRQMQAPNIGLDKLSHSVIFNIPSGDVVMQGSHWCLDVTQPTISPASLVSNIYQTNAPWTPTPEIVVPPFSANAGPVWGVYEGGNLLTSGTLTAIGQIKFYGIGVLLASAEGGNAVNVGSNLIKSATQYAAKQGTAALNSQIGTAIGYFVNTTIAAATPSGAQTVTVPSIVGITTSTALTIDTPASGVMETVTPSAVVSGVNANQTYTVASAGTVSTLTATTGGIAASYTTTAADTATTAAAALVAAINASAAVSGSAPIILPATNSAGVITVRAATSGTGPNSVTTVAAVSGGSVTLTAGGATLASGTASTFTATFANAHGTNVPVQGLQKTSGGALIPGTASALTPYLINAFIRCI
jgi:hypothetical protein